MRFEFTILAMVAAFAASPVLAQTSDPASTPPVASAAASTHFTTEATPLGEMLDNPAARAVLTEHLPDMVGSPQIDMARGITLKMLQAYVPDLTDEKLAAIDADLASLPAS